MSYGSYPWAYPRPNTSTSIARQTETGYLDYEKIKQFEGIGYFLTPYVVSGGVVTKNVKRNDQIDISKCVAVLNDDLDVRNTVEGIQLQTANSTYFVDFYKGDFWVDTAHPQGSAGVDYLTLATVTTDAQGNVGSITDTANPRGGFRLKSQYGLTGYFRPVLNVLDYGATGDGTTDDTSAFQAVLSTSGNGEIIVPPGTYKITSSLLFKGKKLKGYGHPTLKFALSSTSSDGIIMEFSDNSTQATEIDGFIIDLNNTGRHGIWLNGGDYPRISNCRVINSNQDGIHIEPKNSFSWIENYTLDHVQVFNSGKNGFAFVISNPSLQSVFINVGVMINCEVRGVGTGYYAIYFQSDSYNDGAISSLTVINGEFDPRMNGANDGIYAASPTGNGIIERLVFIGSTIENTLESKSGYCLAGHPCFTAIGIVPYNYAAGIVEYKYGNLCLASPGYEFLSMHGITGHYVGYQFIGTVAGQVFTDTINKKVEFGAALTLASTPTFIDGKIEGQQFTIIGAGFPGTLQDDGTLAGSKLKLLSPSITILAGQSVSFRWDGTYWRQICSISA